MCEIQVKVDDGFLCPNYAIKGMETNVYSFGKLVLDLLTRQCSEYMFRTTPNHWSLVHGIRNNAINKIVDPLILAEEEGIGVEQQLNVVLLQLVPMCIDENLELRPNMIDVTKGLRWIEKSIARKFSHLVHLSSSVHHGSIYIF